MRSIHVDVGRVIGANHRSETFCVSASRAYTLMMENHRRHIRMAREECGFRYLRFHGLFQDDMGIYREDAFGNPIWGWQYVDEVYDFLMDAGIRPFVVLDFMPEVISSAPKTIYWERANITPPKDWQKWYELVHRTVCHFRDRYGEDEVAEWFFEVWNEPDGFFWTGSRQEYFELYKHAANAVKAASPRFRVGGPSIAGETEWIDSLAAYCREHATPIDFITAHCYCLKPFAPENSVHPEPGIPVWQPGVAWPLGNAAYDPHGGEEKFREFAAAAERAGLSLYITEFGLSYDYWDPLRDSYEAASWLLSRLRASRENAKCFSICEASDVFEEDGPPVQDHFHGGFGLINLQGIRKPAYFALRFLNELLDCEIACDDARAFATAKGDDEAAILFYDDAVRQTADNKHMFSRPHAPLEAEPVRLTVEGLAPGQYAVRTYAVGHKKNDAYTAFLEARASERDSLSKAEVERLSGLAKGCAESEVMETVNPDGRLTLDFPMRENDVYLCKISMLNRN